MSVEIQQLIGRVRRAMPRNADVMQICDELEKRIRRANCPDCEKRRAQTLARVRKHREAKK